MTTRWSRRLLGAALAAVAGWVAGLAVLGVLVLLGGQPYPFQAWLVVGLVMWEFILPVWLLGFLPFYLLLPRSSPLWRWRIATMLGAVAGAAVIFAYRVLGFTGPITGGVMSPQAPIGILPVIAAIVGGTTALTASLTARRFVDAPGAG